jgi:hypothetical protein
VRGRLARIPWRVNLPDLVGVIVVLFMVVDEVVVDSVEGVRFVEV